MQPVFGFALYLAAAAIVWIVATKKGLAGWVFFLACLVAGPIIVMISSSAGFSGSGSAFAAFLVPVVALVVALSNKSSEQLAVANGSHGDFKKCQFCAESIRFEAVKCKHCGSAINQVIPEENNTVNHVPRQL